MNRMLGYLKGYERESVLAPLFKMLEATFDLFVPLVMADIVNVGIAAHDLHYILVRCGLLLLLAFIQPLHRLLDGRAAGAARAVHRCGAAAAAAHRAEAYPAVCSSCHCVHHTSLSISALV